MSSYSVWKAKFVFAENFPFLHPTAPTRTFLQALPRWQGQTLVPRHNHYSVLVLSLHTAWFSKPYNWDSTFTARCSLARNAISRQTKENSWLFLSCETSGTDLCWLQFNLQPSNQDPFPSALNILQGNFFTRRWPSLMELPSSTLPAIPVGTWAEPNFAHPPLGQTLQKWFQWFQCQ